MPVVCLADDDPSVCRSVARLLELEGYSVASFTRPQAFLAYMKTHNVPVAVIDIWMESMTGMELLAHLCACSPDTRLIFITGHEDRGAEAVVKQAGAFGFFIKPFDQRRFLAAVRRGLEEVLAR